MFPIDHQEKQGYEIAKQLMLNGAKVTLISGPTNLTTT